MVELARVEQEVGSYDRRWRVVRGKGDDTWDAGPTVTKRVKELIGPAADTVAFEKNMYVRLDLKKKKLTFSASVQNPEKTWQTMYLSKSASVVIEDGKVLIDLGMLQRKFREVFDPAHTEHTRQDEEERKKNEFAVNKEKFIAYLQKSMPEIRIRGDRDESNKIHINDNISFSYYPDRTLPIQYLSVSNTHMSTNALMQLAKLMQSVEDEETKEIED